MAATILENAGTKGINPEAPPAAPQRASRHALLCLILVAGCVTVADLLLKRGALAARDSAPADSGAFAQLGIAALSSPYTIVGILFHLAGLAAWIHTLRTVPLTLAYCFTAVQQATIAIGARFWLGEAITPLRWAGIVSVCAGVLFLVPAIVAAEKARGKGIPT